jgi:XTP/dITP diphosphohydrolase
MRLLVATGNRNKLAELRAVLTDWEVDAADVSDQPVEDGRTYEDNARIKARHARRHAPPDAWVLGEDSGIEAAALDGRPGVQSARWAQDGVAALLAALAGERDRSVRFVCTIVAVPPEGEEIVATGTLEGVAADEPRGSEGFGYDPIFVPAGETRTVSQLGDAWKARHSHRARAALALGELLDMAR